MQWSLFLLILMGHWSFATCHLYEYHFIEQNKTWDEAKEFCRGKYTDLATVFKMTDMKKLVGPTKNQVEAWIGLYKESNANKMWSDGSNPSLTNLDLQFTAEENIKNTKKCAITASNHQTLDSADCNEKKPFFCYDDKVILMKENKTWAEALDYCRHNHHDLVSITNPHQQRWVQERAKNADTNFVWLGLRYTCTLDLWFWVNDNVVCYEKWGSAGENGVCSKAAAMEKREHKWHKKDQTEQFNFICAL